MIITCPRCDTSFNMPEELFKPGKKARCSQCGLVFPMLAPSPEPAPAAPLPSYDPGEAHGQAAPPPAAGRKSSGGGLKSVLIGLSSLCLLALLGYGGYLVYTSLSGSPATEAIGQPDPSASAPVPDPAPPAPDAASAAAKAAADQEAEQARIDSIVYLDDIRQFVVDNAHIGKVMLIQGVAVNKSASNKDYIRIRARLLDENRNVLDEKEIYSGVPLTLFQVQNLSEQELNEALNNRVTIMTNNTNIPPGGKTPFVVLFPKPSEAVRRFEVRVIGVSDSVMPAR